MAVPQSDGVTEPELGRRCPAPSIIEGTTMDHYVGIDVSLESSSLCVVDAAGRVVREAKIASEPVPTAQVVVVSIRIADHR